MSNYLGMAMDPIINQICFVYSLIKASKLLMKNMKFNHE
jgi:hypothetical protein